MFDGQPPPLPRRQPIIKGAVGIKTDCGTKWVGVFIDKNANPIAFGEQLWEMLQENWQSLKRWSKGLLECGYWEEYINDSICPFCGKYGAGHPNAVRGDIVQQYLSNGPKSIAPDPKCKGHTHLPPMPTVHSDNAKEDGVWIEWAYVLDPKTYTLEILRSIRTSETYLVRKIGRKWNQPAFAYFSLKLFSLMGSEPNWELVEQQGLSVSKYYHDKFQRCKKSVL